MNRAAKKRASHEAVLASAGEMLRTRGIADSSVGEVMQGAGLTVGGFYGHFDSKESLFVEAIRCSAASGHQRLQHVLQTSPDAALTVVRAYLSAAHRDDVKGGCPLPNTVAEVARAGEPYRSALTELYASFIDPMAEMLGGGDAGRGKAMALFTAMYGALSLSRAVAGTPLSDEILAAALRQAETLISSTQTQLKGGTQ